MPLANWTLAVGAALFVSGIAFIIGAARHAPVSMPTTQPATPTVQPRRVADVRQIMAAITLPTADVNVEFHAEPDGAPRGYAQSYEKRAQQTSASGTLTTPFAGIHGWWWENPTSAPLTVTLKSSGFYHLSHEFRPGVSVKNKTF